MCNYCTYDLMLHNALISRSYTVARSMIGAICRLSVCLSVWWSVCMSVTLCIVAKRYILPQTCLNTWIGSAPVNWTRF